jgi:ribose transport system substrate-binding protein
MSPTTSGPTREPPVPVPIDQEENLMQTASPSRTRRRAAALAAVGVLAVGVAACGSSDDSSTTAASTAASTAGTTTQAASAAADTVAKYSKPITEWPGPNTAFTPPTGKKITAITCSATGITCVRVTDGVKAAGQALGYDVNVVDGKGDPSVWNQAIRAAIANKSNGIVLGAVPPGLVMGAVAAAEKAGIPVVYGLGNDKTGVDLALDTDRAEAGRVLADWVTVDSGGKGKVLVLRDPEFPELTQYDDAFVAQLKKDCTGCSIAGQPDFTLGAMADRLPGIVSTALRTDPDIGYILAPYDSASTFISQGIRQAGKSGIKVLGDGGDPPTMDNLKSGAEVASMGVPSEWIGWQAVDAIARKLAGKPIEEAPVVQGLITKENIDQQAPNGYYDGGFDYQSKYKQLWGK